MKDMALAALPAPASAGRDTPIEGRAMEVVRMPRTLDNTSKAAIIVRLLMTAGEDIPIESLPEDLQARLTAQMGRMGLVDKVTLDAVVREFTDAMEAIGLTFPHGLARALEALDGKISPQTARRLRKEAGVREAGDPWERLRALPVEDLAQMAQAESIEVAAVLLSKLPTATAAQLLTSLPGPLARKMSYAVSQTSRISPDAVDRIGLSLAAQIDEKPIGAFDRDAHERLGEILNQSNSATRDEMLTALEETDADFADQVRRAIFLFEHIPARLRPADVPNVLREVPPADLITALAGARAEADAAAADFLLSNISKRMAEGYREEMAERGAVRQADAEAAMNVVVAAIRQLAQTGALTYRDPEAEETD
jgi:flagellar motor switch protein FliG